MTQQGKHSPGHGPRVSLFVTCLADLFRPSVAWAAIELLEQAGCTVDVPTAQSCCGQPAYNAGEYDTARPLARQVIELLEPADYVVLPSGSCAGMLIHHYPRLLEGDWHDRAVALSAKTFELTTFLSEIAPLPAGEGSATTAVAYHDSCAGLRELGIREQPRELLRQRCDVEVLELTQRDVCCGFGGTFCAKMPDIAAKMSDDKLKDALEKGARVLTGGDLGCLLTLAGRASRMGHELEVRHVAELLVGDSETPAIGEGEPG